MVRCCGGGGGGGARFWAPLLQKALVPHTDNFLPMNNWCSLNRLASQENSRGDYGLNRYSSF